MGDRERPPRPKMTDINPLIVCILCGGYYVDATTIVECMHSYCRACIVAYLRQSKQCPTCDILVHKSRPMQKIRPDTTLQKLVYKMVPGLYRDEIRRRRDFHRTHVQHSENGESTSSSPPEDPTKICDDSIIIYTHDEMISLSLEYCQPSASTTRGKKQMNGDSEPRDAGTDINGNAIADKRDIDARYLRCPAAVQISHLKKFIRNKFGLPQAYKVDVLHREGGDDVLRDNYTLMDIAYIYTWKRMGPLPLLYRICEPLPSNNKRTCSDASMTSTPASNGESPAKSAKIQPPIKVTITSTQPQPVLVT
ncbi:polycomb complex protein BMI-1-like [Patiria miniata]|uniref:RING-type domain-containing protein n=1 Tax=Patiria miniata TaxID=46514 RepID=A0A913Z0G9_PATMI|nr:polycomb complex protein BMI-1-like [Patiria miniata]